MNYLTAITGDLWVMEPGALERLATLLSNDAAIAATHSTAESDGDDVGYQVRSGIAHIPVRGVLMKEVPGFFKRYGVDATGYSDVARAMDDAESDPNVAAVMLDVDSPGGNASGIHAMADRIHGASKPVLAHIDTLGASGAYWMASQADQITAGRGAQVGSIGAYTARVDVSRAAENAGVKVHLFSSGPHKGAGYPGTSLSQEQKDEIQASVDALAGEFVADIARGRGVDAPTVHPSADGRLFSAADALSRGLIDSITSDPAGDYIMAKDLASEVAALKAGMALQAEHPKHAKMIEEATQKGVSIDQIRGDIAVAEKSALEMAAKVELESKVAAVTASLDAEKAEHVNTRARLVLVERERDALAALQRGAAPAAKVQSEAAPKSVRKITQSDYDKLSISEKVVAGKAMASGDLLVEG